MIDGRVERSAGALEKCREPVLQLWPSHARAWPHQHRPTLRPLWRGRPGVFITGAPKRSATALGETPGGAIRRVHLPMISGSLVTAALLIFVDAVKELPATLILRPFNFETLATSVYSQASLEQLAEAAPAAIAIVIVGLAPVLILMRGVERTRQTARHEN